MACRLFGAKHYLNQCFHIVNLTLGNIFQSNFIQNSKVFIQGNPLENVVCEMVAILSRPQCVKHFPHFPPGLSPLHSAVLHKKLSLVEELIDAGAEVDLVEGKSGRTSLHLATETNQHDMVKLLLNKGAGVNLQSYSGSTALHLASGRGLQDIVALLLNSGADSTLRNVYMDVAMANGCGTPVSTVLCNMVGLLMQC